MSGQPHDIFVSYRRGDREFVASVVRRLEARGVTCWYDAGIGAPSTPDQKAAALAKAGLLAVFFSEDTNRARDLQDETGAADDAGKPVMVIALDGTEPRGAVLRALADRNWIKAHPEPISHIDLLVDLMATLAGKGPAPAPVIAAVREASLEEKERRLDDAISDMIHDAVDPQSLAPTDPKAYVGKVGQPGKTASRGGFGLALANLFTLGIYGAQTRARAIRSFRSNIRKL
jgi:hypothetical protein